MAENGTVAYIPAVKECDICKFLGTASGRQTPARADFDVKTKTGQWANVCTNHRATHALQPDKLGIGIGQRLVIRP